MKRDPRLHGLSSEHHDALVLAVRLERACEREADLAPVIKELRRRFDAELLPHFAVEEEVILPALQEAGGEALAARGRREHAALRDLMAAAERGEAGALLEFSRLLTAHIRFEEREMFPFCEEKLSTEVLDEVWRRAPKQGKRCGVTR